MKEITYDSIKQNSTNIKILEKKKLNNLMLMTIIISLSIVILSIVNLLVLYQIEHSLNSVCALTILFFSTTLMFILCFIHSKQ